MAEEVLDSWEDMIDESGVLIKKLEDFRLNDTNQDLRPNVTPFVPNNSNTNSDSVKDLADCTVWPSLCNNKVNDNTNSIKILKRESTPSITLAQNNLFSLSSNDSNQNQSTSVCPQIILEDNTRTQYVPQVRILKRPNAKLTNDSNDLSADRKLMNANKSQTNNKTYEEREAEYAKARLRILGSAAAPEESDNSSLSATAETANTYNSSPKSSQLNSCVESNNVPILRLPIGPDGTQGFKRELTSQQR